MFRSPCARCGKVKFFVRKRSYLVPKVSPKPIVTTDALCGKCAKGLKRTIKLT